jgi:tetratricopeptide (TPR) repeat protein
LNFERIKTITIIVMGIIILGLLVVSEPRKDLWNDLLLSRALQSVKQKEFSEAERLYKRILQKNPHHERALRGLGSVHALNDDPQQAIEYYRRAVILGDVPSLRMLAGMYVKTEDIEKIGELVPELLAHKHEGQEFLNYLVVYAMKSRDRDLFERTLKDVSPEYIQAREDTSQLVAKASEVFESDGTTP